MNMYDSPPALLHSTKLIQQHYNNYTGPTRDGPSAGPGGVGAAAQVRGSVPAPPHHRDLRRPQSHPQLQWFCVQVSMGGGWRVEGALLIFN